jgi:hypothetical protein
MWALSITGDRNESPSIYVFDTEEEAQDAYLEFLKEVYGDEWDEDFDWQTEYDQDFCVWIVPLEE